MIIGNDHLFHHNFHLNCKKYICIFVGVCTKQTCLVISAEQDTVGQDISADLQYFIIIPLVTHFFHYQESQLLWCDC